MNEHGNEADNRMSLPAVVDLPQAGALKSQLERSLASGGGMTIDASAVRRISSPCLQVLIAGVSAFAKAGGSALRIVDPSPEFLETVSVLGLREVLGLKGA